VKENMEKEALKDIKEHRKRRPERSRHKRKLHGCYQK
jgi:hypothetical protein